MVETDYARLDCAGCGVGFVFSSRRGKPRRYCTSECGHKARYKRDVLQFSLRPPQLLVPCASCGAEFTQSHPRRLYCTRLCGQRLSTERTRSAALERERAKRSAAATTQCCQRCGNGFSAARKKKLCHECAGKRPPRERKPALARPPRDPISCHHCSKSFVPYSAGSMYCAKTCKVNACKHKKPERIASKRRRAEAACRKREKEAAHLGMLAAREERRRSKAEQSAAVGPRPCEVCAAPLGTAKRRWCSSVCTKAAPENRAKKAAHRRLYKARRRGVYAEDFSPYEVFTRDGWRCQICGVATPRAKRGTYDDNAPELDHIVPVSKGGEHTMFNTQCACRACNLDKADTLPTEYRCRVGQPRSAPTQAALF